MTPRPRRAGRMLGDPQGRGDARGIGRGGRRDRGREAPRAPAERRLARDRPVADAADPGRVRRGLRRDGQGRPGGHRLRLGPDGTGRPDVRPGPGDRPAAGRDRLRGHHRRRAGHDGGGQSRLSRGWRAVGRLQHRAAARAGDEPVRRPRRRVPLLLRAQGDVRQVRRRVRHPARRPRHARRAVRVADPHPDRQGPPLPGRAGRAATTGRACSTGCAARCSSVARSPRRTWTCST